MRTILGDLETSMVPTTSDEPTDSTTIPSITTLQKEVGGLTVGIVSLRHDMTDLLKRFPKTIAVKLEPRLRLQDRISALLTEVGKLDAQTQWQTAGKLVILACLNWRFN
jgi:hypothetical protein